MKKIISIILAITLSINLVGCVRNEMDSDFLIETTPQNAILLERKDIEIIYYGYQNTEVIGPMITFIVKNNRNRAIRIKMYDDCVNDIQFNDATNRVVSANGEMYITFRMNEYMFQENQISPDEVDKISVKVRVTDENYIPIHFFDEITIKIR